MIPKKYCILIHYHEISLKGDNRRWFEKIFINNIRKQIKSLPYTSIDINAARVLIFGIDKNQWDAYSKILKKVIGLVSATLVQQVKADIDYINKIASKLIDGEEYNTFRVSTKRQYKNFPLTSQEINERTGSYLQQLYKKDVKLKGADLNVYIELVKGKAYIGIHRVRGFGGLPVGTGEKAVSLLSSGIDSPVASFEMVKRGVDLSYVHFHSAPATNRQSIKNVQKLLKILSKYQIQCNLYNIPLLPIQEKIMQKGPNRLWIILFRRAMMQIAELVAEKINAIALITGENVGQVASQTLSNMRAISDVVSRPVIRPLAGMNKEEIINRAKLIGTYQTSIEPYQDCCSFFIPTHPETKANHNVVKEIEKKIDVVKLYEDTLNNAELITIGEK